MAAGFEHFYGFIGGETNQYAPALYENTTPVEPDRTPEEGYHLTEDMTDHAIAWVRQQKALMPDKPFFAYFAPGATHAPHHVPTEWSDKYRGRFDQGWDALREETFARQKELGVVPGVGGADRPARRRSRPGTRCPRTCRPVLARQMEVYAGFLEHTDHHVGRLIDALAELEVLDDTLVYVIIGDNGASAEGDINGCFNELINLNGAARAADHRVHGLPDRRLRHPGRLQPLRGRLGARDEHAVPVDQAGRLALGRHPQRHHRALAAAASTRKGEVRHQFHHVIDVAPTVLEAAGLPEPTFVHGVQQRPYEGVSMGYTFDDARRRRPAPDAVLRDVRQPRHLPPGLDRGHPALDPVGPGQAAAAASTTTSGSSTAPTTGPRPTTSPPRTRSSSRTCSRSSCSRRRSTRCSRSTTGGSSGSTPTSPDDRR